MHFDQYSQSVIKAYPPPFGTSSFSVFYPVIWILSFFCFAKKDKKQQTLLHTNPNPNPNPTPSPSPSTTSIYSMHIYTSSVYYIHLTYTHSRTLDIHTLIKSNNPPIIPYDKIQDKTRRYNTILQVHTHTTHHTPHTTHHTPPYTIHPSLSIILSTLTHLLTHSLTQSLLLQPSPLIKINPPPLYNFTFTIITQINLN
ncbi:hypothetical protein EYC84_005702 [Monilinia fructicola]|uniref:Uncharacterized protein n=1 Tax=Monilinia fructicola TaxID=38448 RepID=A0A5M9K183_MONFR|nr:hypothetical protein EYC84_005702 [Monilinia fructicola]